MTDRRSRDDLLYEVFASYAAERPVVPRGALAVRTTVRRRRLTRAALVGALVVAILIGSASAAALTGWSLSGPPSGTAPPTPGASDPTASRSGALAPVTDVEVRDATLMVTPLIPNCPAARVDFRDGVGPPGTVPDHVGAWRIHKVVPANLDGDAADEVAVLLDCRIGQGEGFEVVAVERDAAGQITTLGTVVVTGKGEFAEIFDVQRAGPTGVRVEVGNVQSCCVDHPERLQRQWRSYGWTALGYAQTGGPTAFPANPRLADLTLTTGPLDFGPVIFRQPGDGWHYGTLSVTIRNNAPFRSGAQLVSFVFPDSVIAATKGWDACAAADRIEGTWCRHGPLDPGESVTLRLEFRIHQGFTLRRDVQPSVRVVTLLNGSGAVQPDSDENDNVARIEVHLD